MMEDWKVEERIMQDLVRILREGEHSLVVCDKEGRISTYDGMGVSDLYRLLHESPQTLEEAFIADKIVGKGAAALIVLGKVREVYAEFTTQDAQAMLDQNHVRLSYGRMVPHIKGRTGTGFCPIEERCRDSLTPQACLVKITEFMEEMKAKKQQNKQ